MLQELVPPPLIKLEVRTARLRPSLRRPLILRRTTRLRRTIVLRRPLTTTLPWPLTTTLLRRTLSTTLRRLLTTAWLSGLLAATLRGPLTLRWPATLPRLLTTRLTTTLWRTLTTLSRLRAHTSGYHCNRSQKHRSRKQLLTDNEHRHTPRWFAAETMPNTIRRWLFQTPSS